MTLATRLTSTSSKNVHNFETFYKELGLKPIIAPENNRVSREKRKPAGR
jgi:hypothetical protein